MYTGLIILALLVAAVSFLVNRYQGPGDLYSNDEEDGSYVDDNTLPDPSPEKVLSKEAIDAHESFSDIH